MFCSYPTGTDVPTLVIAWVGAVGLYAASALTSYEPICPPHLQAFVVTRDK